jgi:hypothetical protein
MPLVNPRRVAPGLEQNRLAMLLAVLHRHGGVGVFDQDVFVNAVGGQPDGRRSRARSGLLAGGRSHPGIQAACATADPCRGRDPACVAVIAALLRFREARHAVAALLPVHCQGVSSPCSTS